MTRRHTAPFPHCPHRHLHLWCSPNLSRLPILVHWLNIHDAYLVAKLIHFMLCNSFFVSVYIVPVRSQTRILKHKISHKVPNLFSCHYWIKVLMEKSVFHEFFDNLIDIGIIWVI